MSEENESDKKDVAKKATSKKPKRVNILDSEKVEEDKRKKETLEPDSISLAQSSTDLPIKGLVSTDKNDDGTQANNQSDPINSFSTRAIRKLPLLPLKDIVILPHTISPLFIGRTKSVAAVEHALENDRMIFVTLQKSGDIENLSTTDLNEIGTIGKIVQRIKLPDDMLKILFDSTDRARLIDIKTKNYIEAEVEILENDYHITPKTIAFMRNIITAAKEYAALGNKLSLEVIQNLEEIDNPDIFCNILVSNILTEFKTKQKVLSIGNIEEKLETVYVILLSEVDILKADKSIQERVQSQLNDNHREYYLAEQLKAINKELGKDDEAGGGIEKYKRLLLTKNLPPEAHKKASEEISRLNYTAATNAENIRTYLDLIFALPWNEKTEILSEIDEAEKALNASHYGLEKVKEHILEYIAVQLNTKKTSGTVLCLYGPPGVGKTSLAKSIAQAMNRKYARISLGGLKDEAEIRGHRRTYVGALPGKIIQTIKKVGVNNPVILLDEIDKLSNDYRGDPSSAMLEVLDPEQNKDFNDHYLEVGFDLSNVLFIATANSLNIQSPLLDRLEIVKVPSYLEYEKFLICKDYIWGKKLVEVGLTREDIVIEDEAIKHIINYYTKEAGVRDLERLINKMLRKALIKIMKDRPKLPNNTVKSDNTQTDTLFKNDTLDYVKKEEIPLHKEAVQALPENVIKESKLLRPIKITIQNLHEFLGTRKYSEPEKGRKNLIGVTNGLAYTEVGGETLLIEAIKIPHGKGEVKITGKLGDVMKESVQAASSYIKANSLLFNIPSELLDKYDIHVHIPEGSVPKDGPSAGITICTSLLSLLIGVPVKSSVAMTGEITLRGKVLPIGGLREKLVAAIRANIPTVIIPSDNKKDLDEIPSYIKDNVKIVLCESFAQVVKIAFEDNSKLNPTLFNEHEMPIPNIPSLSSPTKDSSVGLYSKHNFSSNIW